MSLYFGPANATALGQRQPRTREGLRQVWGAVDCAEVAAFRVTSHMQWLLEIAAAVPSAQMIFGVGLQEESGSSNASCAGAKARHNKRL